MPQIDSKTPAIAHQPPYTYIHHHGYAHSRPPATCRSMPTLALRFRPPSAELTRPRYGTNSQDMPNPTFLQPPYILTSGSHRSGPPLYGPCPPGRPWSASPDGLPTPPGPGCETVPISEARHVPDTAPIDPRLARVSKICIIERLLSVYYAAR